jgi:hypothetical protein
MKFESTGGPAFPTSEKALLRDLQGMSLRDYFAAQALQGAISHGLFNAAKAEKSYAEYLSSLAYVYADAMLKAREA